MRRWGFCLLVTGVFAACSEPSAPALQVGDLVWDESELLGLSPDQIVELAELAALGLAIADGAVLDVLEPAIARDRETALQTQAAAEAYIRDMGVGDEQLRARYAFDPELELTVRHVLFFSERWRADEHRAEARRKAEAALTRLRSGEPFPEVAAELSEEPGAEGRQGLLTPGREGSWVPEFWAAALRLEVGDISPVTETQYGFHVLQLEGRAEVPFEEARPAVVLQAVATGNSLPVITDDWLDRLEEQIVLDEDVLLDFIADGTPAGRVLASWPEGDVTDALFYDHVVTDADAADQVAGGEPTRVADVLLAFARTQFAIQRAQSMGVRIPDSEEARIAQEWDATAARWTAALGFQPELTSQQVKAAARAALDRTGQTARIARTEVHRYGSILLAAYGVSMGEADEGP